MRNYGPSTLILLMVGSAACTSVESKNVRTDGLFADFEARADGSGKTSVEASLRVGGSTGSFVDLDDGDKLVAHNGMDNREMDLGTSLFGMRIYDESFDADDAGESFRIEFQREAHDSTEEACRGGGAPNSVVTLPAKFTISSPAADTAFGRAMDAITINWNAANDGDEMEGKLDGECVHSKTFDIGADNGAFTIDAGEIEARDMEEGTTCDITIQITRKRAGTVDDAYGEGGRFIGKQVREIELSSRP